jgi:hypothetical protein
MKTNGTSDQDRKMAELCAMCQAEFATPAELVEHIHKVHSSDRPGQPEIPNAV